MLREQIIQNIKKILSDYHITKASLFGSFARNENDFNDIDILIETNTHSMFDILKMENEIQQSVKTKIDIVEFKSLKNSIRSKVLNEAVPLL